ncbi:MAG TPA: MobF family relaxase [Thermoanaerobaculia bacterium]|nr:MobF family relaxase [Thermoanaerobaculia bacterium]
MIRGSRPLTFDQAAGYYRREYTRGDYYTSDRTASAGVWQGRGTELLGLAGEVAREDFAALLQGRSPLEGRQLVAAETATGKHRAAWDFQAAPDKSVSLVALLGGDERVIAAHLDAAARAFAVLEQHALTRDRDRQLVPTGNLVMARFDHDSSRALDPQLHSHYVILNLTHRGRGQWRALEPSGLYAGQSLATAIYHAELARGLQALGYEVRANTRGHVRIAGIPEEALATFSKRRRQILAEVERQGGSSPDPQRAALRTRSAKNRDVDPAALRAAWHAEADRLGIDFAALRRDADLRLAAGRHLPPGEPLEQARSSVAWAVEHLSERQAAFRGMDLETFALRHGAALGPGLDEIRAACASHPGLVRGAGNLVTTQEALRLERRNLQLVRTGRTASGRPVLDRPYAAATGALHPDQLRVVRHILEGREQVLAVEGKPGTGKTFALAAVRDSAVAAGWSVRGFAVSTGAVAQLREVGIEAATLKHLAVYPPEGPAPRQLWLVDEAGLMSNRDASTALESAQRAGARLVFVGDRRQHHGVEAGNPWASFQAAGLRPARLDAIRRQRDPELLAAVELAASGRAGDAMRHLDARGHVVEIASARERHAAMALDFAAAPHGTLMIAPSHAERRDLNFLARRELVGQGKVAPQAVAIEVAVGKGVTGAQRADLRHYEVSDVVAYHRAAPSHGIRAGDVARVVEVDRARHSLRVERYRDGAVFEYDPRRLRGGDLARVESRELAAGDRVQFRRADRSRSIANGATAAVREAAPSGRLLLQLDGRAARMVTLDASRGPLPLDHAYAVTSHAAQGSTARRVLATFDSRHSAELVNRQQANVTLSRASHQLVVYTDDRAALPAAVDRQARKTSALDVRPPERSDRHALAPLQRPTARRHAGRHQPKTAEPVRRAAFAAPGTEPPRAARHRPQPRAVGRGGPAERPRAPRPRPGGEREPRPQRRAQPAAQHGGHHLPRPHRSSPLHRDRLRRDARHSGRGLSPDQRPRSVPADSLPQKLIAAVERWQDAKARREERLRRKERPRAFTPPAPRRGRPSSRAAPAPSPRPPRPASHALRALTRLEDVERQLVSLLEETGVYRALALLPPGLVRAIEKIPAIARYVADLTLGR